MNVSDGNGNVTAILAPDGDSLLAAYLYDPYGRTLQSSGTWASANVYRFSSKEVHPNSGLYYYGYRFYDPNLQRWINRDPIGEAGGINLYGFVGNGPVNWWDILGLAIYPCDFVGPLLSGDSHGPLFSNPTYRPPGWNPTWPTGSDKRGPYTQNPSTGRRYYPDTTRPDRHWPHYDWEDPNGKEGRYPEKCLKKRPNQKRANPNRDQSATNPWLGVGGVLALSLTSGAAVGLGQMADDGSYAAAADAAGRGEDVNEMMDDNILDAALKSGRPATWYGLSSLWEWTKIFGGNSSEKENEH
jgi:RHS repeat-associated protein